MENQTLSNVKYIQKINLYKIACSTYTANNAKSKKKKKGGSIKPRVNPPDFVEEIKWGIHLVRGWLILGGRYSLPGFLHLQLRGSVWVVLQVLGKQYPLPTYYHTSRLPLCTSYLSPGFIGPRYNLRARDM